MNFITIETNKKLISEINSKYCCQSLEPMYILLKDLFPKTIIELILIRYLSNINLVNHFDEIPWKSDIKMNTRWNLDKKIMDFISCTNDKIYLLSNTNERTDRDPEYDLIYIFDIKSQTYEIKQEDLTSYYFRFPLKQKDNFCFCKYGFDNIVVEINYLEHNKPNVQVDIHDYYPMVLTDNKHYYSVSDEKLGIIHYCSTSDEKLGIIEQEKVNGKFVKKKILCEICMCKYEIIIKLLHSKNPLEKHQNDDNDNGTLIFVTSKKIIMYDTKSQEVKMNKNHFLKIISVTCNTNYLFILESERINKKEELFIEVYSLDKMPKTKIFRKARCDIIKTGLEYDEKALYFLDASDNYLIIKDNNDKLNLFELSFLFHS